jgi:hypothetical protein
MGYPKTPAPNATNQEKRDFERFLDRTYRPWLNGDDPLPNDAADPGWGEEQCYQRQQLLRKSKEVLHPDVVALCAQWLERAGVAHLSRDNPKRRRAMVEWARWFTRQPPDLSSMAVGDLNREGPPRGWTGVSSAPAQGSARATLTDDPLD